MASAQQKKKPATGVRNPDRRNGKAPKKNPKIPRTLSPEEKAERDRIAAERRVHAAQKREAERHVTMMRIHEMALRMNHKFDIDKKVREADEARKAHLEDAKKLAHSFEKASK